jgi:biopolymer transport protein ExbD|tara:strand:+ start:953 stop:1702 length:750 start_codon:yes stop_codon:yes gene_type:complete
LRGSKKEIQVFTISFLDVLSCALGAIIILFVIVPKSQIQQNLQAELHEVRAQLRELNESQPIVTNIDSIQQLLIREAEARRDAEEEVQRLIAEVEELRNEQSSNSGSGFAIFGIDAQFGVVINWPENLDVDLWVREVRSGKWCCYAVSSPGFAKYYQDVRSRSSGDKRYELVYQDEVKSGEYDVYIHLYSNRGVASVSGYSILYPYTSREKKVLLPHRKIRHNSAPHKGGGHYLGRIIVDQNSLLFNAR